MDRKDQAPDGVASSWLVRGVYAVLIAANLWLAFDWWSETEQGRATIDRAKAWAAGCEGCARRRAWLDKQTHRMHREARAIVEGAGRAIVEGAAPDEAAQSEPPAA